MYMVSSRSLILLLLLGIYSQFSLNTVVGQDANTGGESTAKISAGSLEIELSTLQEKLRRRSLEELERRKAQLNRLDQLRYESRNQERLNNAIQKQLSELESKNIRIRRKNFTGSQRINGNTDPGKSIERTGRWISAVPQKSNLQWDSVEEV